MPDSSVAMKARSVTENSELYRDLSASLDRLREWIESQDYSGYEPYDVLNSPLLSGWARHQPFASLFIQGSKRMGGLALRRLLRVQPSKNPKALALMLAGYCDLARCGSDTREQAQYIKRELIRLRSAGEAEFCWGYDWYYASIRGATLPPYSPNCIASCFAGGAMLDMAEAFADAEARSIAESVGRFLVARLPRTIDTPQHLCFSYTPAEHTVIYNNSALAAALLARLAGKDSNHEYATLARRAMQFLADGQNSDGGWPYGRGPMQGWVDGFHTAYNIVALLDYRNATGDTSFDPHIRRGYCFYSHTFFLPDGTPRYYDTKTHPVDIHSCSQALITFSDFFPEDAGAKEMAERVARYTLRSMTDGTTFYYQRHRFHTDKTPYMRWGQAWMFRALARMKACYFSELN